MKRVEYLSSQTYADIAEQANKDAETLGTVIKQIQTLLFQRVKGEKANPFKDLATFALHRKAVSDLYNRAVALNNTQVKAIQTMTQESLYASDTVASRVSRAVRRYLTLVSVPVGVAIAAAGHFGVPAAGVDNAFKAAAYFAGAMTAASPVLFG